MKTIIVATDFSDSAFNATKYAAEMAMAIKAGVLLFHVYDLPTVYSEVPFAIGETEIRNQAQSEINVLKSVIENLTNNKIVVKTELRMGSFFKELKGVCKEVEPYAVILGSQGKSAVERLFFGSNTIHVMKHLTWPLITVPAGARFSSVKKIGLACDLHEVVDTVPVDEIKMLVNDFKAALLVLNTGKQEVYDPEIVFETGLLQEMLIGLNPSYHFITSENLDNGILEFCEKNQIDLLVVFPKRHGLLDALMHKSHSKQLVLHSHVPVLALHQ